MGRYLYLFLDIITFILPLISFIATQQFRPQIKSVFKWKRALKSIFIVGCIFIIWDIFFTRWGIWGFNKNYLIGIFIMDLPLEEWLFFIVVPLSCMFIYEGVSFFFLKKTESQIGRNISLILAVFLSIVSFFFMDRLYASTTFLATSILLGTHVFVLKSNYLNKFYLGYLFSLVPFFIVNGILTGGLTNEPIVWYNTNENLSLRIYTIPIEDTIYLLLLLLGNITVYEYMKNRQ